MTSPLRLSPLELVERQQREGLQLIDVREPVEFVGGHIAGSRNLPLERLAASPLPPGPLVLICRSGNRSLRGLEQLQRRGHAGWLADLEGGVLAWEAAGLPLQKRRNAPLPLLRQVQIAAGSLVLLGVILAQLLAPAWILLSALVGAGLVFAGVSGWCGMALLLARMPWNQISDASR
ncbi:MAG: rhodanese-like domain-containing protein [Synechococcaceae cyanobacterium]|nr:rhodanese-like domain-containing protein [Synechococcaceae cyanobacterium]